MKVIIVNRFFAPDQSATSRMATSLAAGLAAQGLEVEAIASAALHDDPSRCLPRSETIGGVRVTRIAGGRFGRRRLIGRALDYAVFHIAGAWRLLRLAAAGDVCIVCTDPPLMSVSALAPLVLKRAALVNWLNDLFPEVAFDAGVLRAGGVAGRLTLVLRDLSLRRAALNVAPMERMAAYLQLRGSAGRRAVVIPHWSEGDGVAPMAARDSRLRREWGLEGKFVLGYCGNLGRAHDFGCLLAAAQGLKDRDDIVFLIVGGGHRLAWLQAEAERRKLANFVFKPLQPENLLRDCLAAPDAHLVTLLAPFEISVIPSKFYGVLAAGRPALFVGAADGEIARTVRENACGEAFGVEDAPALAACIRALAADPDLAASWGANARALFDARFSRARGLLAWREAVASCAAAGAGPALSTSIASSPGGQ